MGFTLQFFHFCFSGGDDPLIFGLEQNAKYTGFVETVRSGDAPAFSFIQQDQCGLALQSERNGFGFACIQLFAQSCDEVAILHGMSLDPSGGAMASLPGLPAPCSINSFHTASGTWMVS